MGLKVQRHEKIDLRNLNMTGIVLAGGNATRMGCKIDKAFLKIEDEPIINRQLSTLKKLFKEIIVVTNSTDNYRDVKGVRVISDVFLGRGPLGGIYSGLLASHSFHNFVIACDMPFINESLIRYMLKNKAGYDIVISRVEDRFHPLFGVYSKNCTRIIEEMLKQNDLKISNLFSKVATHFISRQEMERFDKKLHSLVNINTKDDFDAAKDRRG